MEQQKILWIILSVAVLLLVVLGAGLFMFGPSQAGDAVKTDSERVITTDEFDPIEWARSSESYPGVTEEEIAETEEDFVVVYGESTEKADKPVIEKKVVEIPVVKEIPKQKEAVKAPVVKPLPVKPVVKAAPKPAVKVNVTEYWIQTGSFTSLSSAENAKQLLVLKGFSPSVQTKTVNSQTYFRVRLGPYTSKEEADKFLNWVKGIDSFTESYVSKVYTKR